MASDGKDPTVGKTNYLSAKSLFQYRNGRVWVTMLSHPPEFADNILDKSPQGYIYSKLQKTFIMGICFFFGH